MDRTPVHPLWRPFDPGATARRASRRVAQRQIPVAGLRPPRSWRDEVDGLTALLTAVLGDRMLSLMHIGSTAVEGLVAKPILDLDLAVTDPADEEAWLPDLERAGFRLIAREPEWEEHRCLTYPAPNTNLHVFAEGAIEAARHVAFRDRLRGDHPDAEMYARAKEEASGSDDYNSNKAGVVYDIYEKLFDADPAHPHHPRPRH